MRSLCLFCFVITYSTLSQGQGITLIATLPDNIEETSGLIYLNEKLITHNDSGGEPALYELDDLSGNIMRSVTIENATNRDWEDICFDSTYIYIADFGNNNGARTDLKIYRLLISDYLTTPNDTVSVDTINFSYSDQIDFTSSSFSTNFDAEALIAYNDSLYIFTKNWGDNWTNIYALPKTPGSYQVEKIDSIDVQGLITGGTYDETEETFLLSGYTFVAPFIVEIRGVSSDDFSKGTINRFQLDTPAGYSIQIEGVSCFQANQYYLTAETNVTGNPALYKLNLSALNINAIDPNAVIIYPNPTSNYIEIRGVDFSVVEIYDGSGSLKKISSSPSIRVCDLASGLYSVVGKDSNGNGVFSKKILIQ